MGSVKYGCLVILKFRGLLSTVSRLFIVEGRSLKLLLNVILDLRLLSLMLNLLDYLITLSLVVVGDLLAVAYVRLPGCNKCSFLLTHLSSIELFTT